MTKKDTPGPEHDGWWVVDVQRAGDYQVVVGPREGPGKPLSRSLRGPASRILPAAIRTVVRTEKKTEGRHQVRDNSFTVTALPVTGPSGQVVAVICSLRQSDATMIAPPLVGAWEWDLDTEQGRGTPDLFNLAIIPEQFHPASFSMTQYSEGLKPPSVAVVWSFWERMRSTTTDELLHETVIREGADGKQRRELICGRPLFSGDFATRGSFSGVTLDATDRPAAAEDERASLGVLDAVLAHSSSHFSMATVDGHIFRWLTDPPACVAWPSDPHLLELVHPADRETLNSAFTVATSHTPGQAGRGVMRFPSRAGQWCDVQLACTVVQREEARPEGRHLVIAMDPVDA